MTEVYNITKNESLQSADQASFYQFSNFTEGTSKLIKTGAGYLTGLVVNSASTTVLASLYDGTTFGFANVINSSLSINMPTDRSINFFNVRFSTGLLLNISGTASVMVAYK